MGATQARQRSSSQSSGGGAAGVASEKSQGPAAAPLQQGGVGAGAARRAQGAGGNSFIQEMIAGGNDQSPEAMLDALGAGRPLDKVTATRLGADVDDVRIHDDAAAHLLADHHSARAFTVGSHIAFAAGAYRPGTEAGDELLRHEIAHVVQQRGASQSAPGPGPTSARHDAFEKSADAAATGGEQAAAGSAGGLRIQKKGEIEATESAVGNRIVENMDKANGGGNADTGMHYAHNYKHYYPEKWKEEYRMGTADPTYFTMNGFMDFNLVPGQSASEAIKKFIKGRTICECLTTIVAMQVDAMRAAMGDEKFDENFGQKGKKMSPDRALRICTDVSATPLGRAIKRSDAAVKGDIGTIGNRPNVKPGEWYYFYNHPKYLLKHPGGAWQGENALYVGERNGEQTWSGFGASNVSEDHMMDQMVLGYNAPRTEYDYQVLAEQYMSDVAEVKSGNVSSWKRLYEVHKEKVPAIYREDGGEFVDSVDKKVILDAPEYEISGTSRKGGFLLDAGSAVDVEKVKAMAK